MNDIKLFQGSTLIAMTVNTSDIIEPRSGMSVFTIIMIAIIILLVAAVLTMVLLPRREEPIKYISGSRRRSSARTSSDRPRRRAYEDNREEPAHKQETHKPPAQNEIADVVLPLKAEIEALKVQLENTQKRVGSLAADIENLTGEYQRLKKEVRSASTSAEVFMPPHVRQHKVDTPQVKADGAGSVHQAVIPSTQNPDEKLIEDYNNAQIGSAEDRDSFKALYDYILFGIPESAIFLRGLNENAEEDYTSFQETADGRYFGVKITKNNTLHLYIVPVFNAFNTGDEAYKKDYGFFQLFEAPGGVSEYRLVQPARFTVTAGRINYSDVERGIMVRR